MTSRRAFLRGLTGFVACAPALVKASSLMPVKALKPAGYRVADYLVDPYWFVKTNSELREFIFPGIHGIIRKYDHLPAYSDWAGAV